MSRRLSTLQKFLRKVSDIQLELCEWRLEAESQKVEVCACAKFTRRGESGCRACKTHSHWHFDYILLRAGVLFV